ncbi:hypothetical protein EDD16DRAFT_1480038 [Pisolithus croceorrhizus]|nr:hypothetical protein EDD16DRAFT_1480038 [Pisolithus croceorrhizus]KAI6120386.1 hypothetical protein EV401DRAFT_1860008 [Pisolithus croceorrhizus]
MGHAVAPTIFLPPLVHPNDYTLCQVLERLHTLKRLYFPHSLSSQLSSAGVLSPQTRIILDPRKIPARCMDHVPDSGYASAEEDSKSIVERDDSDAEEGDEVFLELLRADDLERGFAVKWLTGFLKRADSWMTAQSTDCPIGNEGPKGGLEEGEGIERSDIFSELKEVFALLSRIAGYGEEDDSSNEITLARQFRFPFNRHSQTVYTTLLNDDNHGADATANQEFIVVELNDASLDAVDHTAVGLQSWASAILPVRPICAQPRYYVFPDNLDMSTTHPSHEHPRSAKMRVPELGAGVGPLAAIPTLPLS